MPGWYVAGVYYIFVRSDGEGTLFGALGSGGVVAMKCNKCVVLATFTKPRVMGECSVAVNRVGEYLKSTGF